MSNWKRETFQRWRKSENCQKVCKIWGKLLLLWVNQPEEEVPKEARSWSNRSKTDNSKSEAMGLGLGKDNGLQLLVLSTGASMSVCKQGALVVGGCWPVSCKWEGRFLLLRLTIAALLVFEFSSSDGSVRNRLEAASVVYIITKRQGKQHKK